VANSPFSPLVLTASILWILLYNLVFIQQASAQFPSGCSTYIVCNMKSENAKSGLEVCSQANDKSKILVKAHWKDGKLHGPFWCAKDDGTPYIEAHFEKGELHGFHKVYDKSLADWRVMTPYKYGKRDGLVIKIGGQKNQIIQYYKDDEPRGFEWNLDSKGKVLSRRSCQVGSKRVKDEECPEVDYGRYAKSFDEYEDQLKLKNFSEKNKIVENKDAKGSVRSTYQLVDGKIEGTVEDYYKPENQLALSTTYKAGKRLLEKQFFKDGQLQTETIYSDGKISSQKVYYQNGKLREEITYNYKHSEYDLVTYKTYYDTGKISEEGQRIEDPFKYWPRPHDKIVNYSPSGEVVAESNFSFGKRVGLWKFLTHKYWIEEDYLNDVLKERRLFDKSMRTLLMRRTTFMEDGSIKQDLKDASFRDED